MGYWVLYERERESEDIREEEGSRGEASSLARLGRPACRLGWRGDVATVEGGRVGFDSGGEDDGGELMWWWVWWSLVADKLVDEMVFGGVDRGDEGGRSMAVIWGRRGGICDGSSGGNG